MNSLNPEITTGKSDYPLLSERIQSTFIDTIFIIILMFISASWLDKYEHAPDWIRIVLFFGIWAVYEPLCTTLGGTIGNRIKGIQVQKFGSPNKRINIFQALFRYLIKMSLGWLSFLTIHMNKERRAVHDLVVNSIMVRK